MNPHSTLPEHISFLCWLYNKGPKINAEGFYSKNEHEMFANNRLKKNIIQRERGQF